MINEDALSKILTREFPGTYVASLEVQWSECTCGCSFCKGKQMRKDISHYKLFIGTSEYYLHVLNEDKYTIEGDNFDMGY
jgi:hypothetical protein